MNVLHEKNKDLYTAHPMKTTNPTAAHTPVILLKTGFSGLHTSAVNVEVTVYGHVPQAELFATVKNSIASAPELLAALEAIANSDNWAGGPYKGEVQRVARAAISKAKGNL